MAIDSDTPNAGAGDDEPVPKLPRGRGLKFSRPELFRIGLLLITLVGLIMMTRPCANAVSGFVTGMDGSGSAATDKTRSPSGSNAPVPQHYEQLTPNMTEAQLKEAIERSKARAAGSAASP